MKAIPHLCLFQSKVYYAPCANYVREYALILSVGALRIFEIL